MKHVNVFLWTCKCFYCYCIYNCVKNIDLLCWVYKKNNSFLSFHPPIFHSKIHERRGIFLRRGVTHQSKHMLREGGLHVKRIGTNKRGRGSEIENFERPYFLNTQAEKALSKLTIKIFSQCLLHHSDTITAPANIYLFKFNNKNTRKRCESCLKLTIKTPEWCQWRRFGVFIVNFEDISHLFLVFLLMTLNR